MSRLFVYFCNTFLQLVCTLGRPTGHDSPVLLVAQTQLTTDRDIGKLIASLRKARGLSQTALGEMATLVNQTVYRIEAGHRPRWITMEHILTALGKEAKLPRDAVEAICRFYGIDPGRLDPRLVQADDDTERIHDLDDRDLHDLLHAAIRALGRQPRAVRDAAIIGLRAQLQALANSDDAPSLLKRHPPKRVGDYDVEVVEPASPPPSPPSTSTKKSG